MSVPVITIADAVVTALNAATLSQSITFSRCYVPKFDTASGAAWQGKVAPKSDAREMGTMVDDTAAIAIDVGVMKKLTRPIEQEVAEVDEALQLCEEIKAVVNRERLAGEEAAVCVGTTQEPIYSVESIEDGRVFLTAITLLFQSTVSV